MYTWKHPELSNLECLKIENMLKLSDFNIEMITDEYTHEGLLIEHGSFLSKHCGMSAQKQLESRGCPGISSHTHRLGIYRKRDASGLRFWIENGCLCSLKPEYCAYPNWQQGFTWTE